MLSRWCFLIVSNLIFLQAIGGPYNIAPEAKITASNSLENEFGPEKVIDGIIGVPNKGEWSCLGQTKFWGYIRYPWIQLEWGSPLTIDKVILYDRAGLDEHSAGGTLIFSDGTELNVTAIPNDGTAKLLSFPPREVDWIRFQITDGDGKNLGFSEIEVFPAYASYQDLVSWVNPFIETTRGRYFFFTPGSRPFGMIAAAPHTRNKNQWGGGYNYNVTEILGFGQVHGWMLSGIDIMPVTGSPDPTQGQQGWKSPFSHDDEIAQPGYQRVYLRKYKTWVENTATDRVSFYRYRFTEGGSANVLTSLGGYLGSTTMSEARVKKINDQEFEGSISSTGRLWGGPEKVRIFFVVQFDQPFESFDGWSDDKILKNISELSGSSQLTRRDSMTYGNITQSYFDSPPAGVSASFQFEPGDKLQMKVAISYTSIDNARENLTAECDHWDFDMVRSDAQAQWNEWLGKIEVKGGTYQQRVKFYTDLWHVLLGRHILNDVNGDYPDYTEGKRQWKFTQGPLKVRSLPKDENGQVIFNMYNSDALWLTQWNVNVLWGLAWPGVLDDFSASMVQYADNGGLLPRGPCAGGYSFIMTGTPVTNMLVSAFMKGLLRKTDPAHAFEVMKRNHMPGGMMGDTEEELSFYIDKGWCPGNAGKTLEWAFQDWSLSQMAKKMGNQGDYEYFGKRSNAWKVLYNPDRKLIFPQDESGSWLHDDPLSGEGWIEANAWQGTWSLSHDIAGLANLMGGYDTLCKKLNYSFEKATPDDFVFGYGTGYVSYANQPGCSNAHVFNHAGKPWLSQYWVRKVNEQAYGAITPDKGYGGHDEDQGQMGGVSALMSIGLFSLRGNNTSDPIYEITSPVFDQVIIHLDSKYYPGKKFEILTRNNSHENMYIQSVSLNGKPLKKAWFYHEEFARGGKLEIELGSRPNKEWGSRSQDLPLDNSFK